MILLGVYGCNVRLPVLCTLLNTTAFLLHFTHAFPQCRRVACEVDPAASNAANGFDNVVFDAALECISGLSFQLQKSTAAGRFEWSDGFLVDALQVCDDA